jgi:ribonuclease HI
LRWRREEKLISGGVMLTTNNRMEMMGALQGLRLLKKPSEVIVTTDSLYLQKGMTEWVVGWQKKGLLEKPNGRIKNQDLWKALLDAALPHKVRWCWVKGHAGHAENERVDRAARVALVQIKLEQAEGEM